MSHTNFVEGSVMAAGDPENVFSKVERYDWDSDEDFQSGLKAILGGLNDGETTTNLTLQARCFYFSRQFSMPVNFEEYRQWRARYQLGSLSPPPVNGAKPLPKIPEPPAEDLAQSSIASSQEPQAQYPSSFAHIVELITSGKPIPGIKEIPPTVLEGQGTQSTASKRRKPWEKDEQPTGT